MGVDQTTYFANLKDFIIISMCFTIDIYTIDKFERCGIRNTELRTVGGDDWRIFIPWIVMPK